MVVAGEEASHLHLVRTPEHMLRDSRFSLCRAEVGVYLGRDSYGVPWGNLDVTRDLRTARW